MPAATDVGSQTFVMIAPEDSIMDAARLMYELDVDALPVGDGHTVLGVVTDRDITVRAAAQGRAPKSMAVAEVMRWRADDEPAEAMLALAIRPRGAQEKSDRVDPATTTLPG